MRPDFFEFKQTQKHIVLGNYKPRLRGDDPAMSRRMLLLPFGATFSGPRADKSLSEKLRREYPGVLVAALIRAAGRWYKDGLQVSAIVRQASAEYLGANDDISPWIDELCVLGSEHKSSTAQLYAS